METNKESSIQSITTESEKRKRLISLHFIVRTIGILMIVGAIGLFGYDYMQSMINQSYINEVVELLDVSESIQERIRTENPDLSFEEVELLTLSEMHEKFAAINRDYVGWIIIRGTKVNYPFVLGQDNVFYLNHNFQRRRLKHGAIFMDYRNRADFSDQHIVLYGHAMRDLSMFGVLDRYKNASFFRSHPTIEIRLKNEIRTYRIFSAYQVDATHVRLSVPANNRDIQSLFDLFLSRALYPTQTSITGKDHILTLVSCTDDVNNGRIIVHAVLESTIKNP